MAQDDRQSPGNLRRVSARDRKTRLHSSGPLFPEDESDDTPPARGREGQALPDDFTVEAPDDDLGEALTALFPRSTERFPPLPDDLPPPEEEEVAAPPPAPVQEKKRRGGDWRHNLIAVFFLLATVALCGVYAIIWQNPYTPLNPLAPATPFMQVTWTPAPPGAVIADATGDEAAQPLPPAGDWPFALDGGEVVYAPNETERGCDWASIAGTVTGLEGEPLENYAVHIVETDDPDQLDVRVFSGASQVFGPGSFELVLGGAPRESGYTVQLFTPAGAPVSDVYEVHTRANCEENVAIVDFVQVAGL
jgi:hypothetical protein